MTSHLFRCRGNHPLLLLLVALFTFTSQADAGLKIYYIRHAQGGHNVKRAWEKKDVPKSEWPSYVGNPGVFTPAGEQQVAAATEKLKEDESKVNRGLRNTEIWMVEQQEDGSYQLKIYNDEVFSEQ